MQNEDKLYPRITLEANSNSRSILQAKATNSLAGPTQPKVNRSNDGKLHPNMNPRHSN